ncbi:sensor histidine kinase [Oscillospiraceae bacterium N12]|uniref:histidine kinase n=1 Tax=Jilunia laotingensis TaxID=2763675 RepID=A0A926F5Y1_9BACT|nr:HAMP domain-containing histidine kinase [Jilunia laotingensis]MBC8592504.1 sensor histidine kinase [Jilunia laotingensis]
MKRLLIFLAFVWFGLSLSLKAEEAVIDSLYWSEASREVEERNYEEAARTYVKLIEKGDSLFRVYAIDRVEDMREKYSIDELELQNNAQQNHLWKLIFIIILFLVILILVGFLYLGKERRKLIQSKDELLKAKTQAEESVRNKSLFLSNMSHEIKTPLNALAGFSEVLITPGIDEATRIQCNDVIQLNSELLLKLISDVVDISCLDVANMQFSIAPVEVVGLSRNVVKMLENIKQTAADVRFETEIPSLVIETDQCRLQQLLINLLVNATKFTKEGSIILALRTDENGFAEFSVADTGCGIPLDKQGAIFGRFEKLNEGMQGTGLGLSICKLIINRLGGEIWVDPAYTSGARLAFTHPLKQKGE